MKKLRLVTKILIACVLPLLMLSFILLSVDLCSGDRAWLEREYRKLDVGAYTRMSNEDMVRAFMQMVDYMKGDAESMRVLVTVNGSSVEMYNEREIEHMEDVRALYKGLTAAACFVFALALAALILALVAFRPKQERKAVLTFASKAALISFLSIFGFILIVGAWAALDFRSFWDALHIVFLDLESSTFDPAVSRMIRICPPELFFDMVIRIFALGLAACALPALAGGAYLLKTKSRPRAKGVREPFSV